MGDKMGAIILTANNWAENIGVSEIKRDIRVKPEENSYDEYIKKLWEEAKAMGLPKAIIRECIIGEKSENEIIIDGMPHKSSLLIEKLKETERIYAYVATCGIELDKWAKKYINDPLYEFISSSIMKLALSPALNILHAWVRENTDIEKFAALNPGSLPSYPITGQRQVFGLIAGSENGYATDYVKEKIGVDLAPSYLMIPLKSVSGIIFKTNEEWHNCSRCSKKECPDRRAEMSVLAEEMISSAGVVESIVI